MSEHDETRAGCPVCFKYLTLTTDGKFPLHHDYTDGSSYVCSGSGRVRLPRCDYKTVSDWLRQRAERNCQCEGEEHEPSCPAPTLYAAANDAWHYFGGIER